MVNEFEQNQTYNQNTDDLNINSDVYIYINDVKNYDADID